MLYVVTAVHNRFKITEKFVKQLLNQTYKDVRLVIVDDGCTDGTSEMVRTLVQNSVILQGNGNLWWGGAMHKAYKWLMKNATPDDNILIMNDDTFFENDFFEKGLVFLEKNKKCLITGCGYSINSNKQIDGAVIFYPDKGLYKWQNGTAEGNCASTRALIMEYNTMKKTGGFHPILLPHYASDYEYTIRAAKKGFKIKAFAEFNYKFDEGTSGNHNSKNATLKQIFSKRSVFNPIYRLSFIFFVTPIKHLPSHLYAQFKRYLNKE